MKIENQRDLKSCLFVCVSPPTADSIKKTFDLIRIYYKILCNITAQTQLRLGMVSQTQQSNVHQNPSRGSDAALRLSYSEHLTFIKSDPSKQEVIYGFVQCVFARAHKTCEFMTSPSINRLQQSVFYKALGGTHYYLKTFIIRANSPFTTERSLIYCK